MTAVPVDHKWEKANWEWPLQAGDGIVQVHNTTNSFFVTLDVPYFTPDEIKVVVEGDYIIINCNHVERSDEFGQVSRSLARTYHLPADVDKKSIKSLLHERGHLRIEGNKKK